MTEEELEKERWIDDDYAVVSQFYSAKRMYPNIPFYLQDENGDNYEFAQSNPEYKNIQQVEQNVFYLENFRKE